MGITSTDPLSFVSLVLALGIAACLACLLVIESHKGGQRYPPGPRSLPIIGNLLDLARNKENSTYQSLARKYGDLVFMSTFGKHILVVNSFKTAYELLEKQSVNYSDRPQSTMSHELLGWDFSFSHMMYGERWKNHRRMFHRQFQQSVAPTYQPIQRREVHALLRNLLHRPDDFDFHLRHNAAAVVMSVTYGIKIAPSDDLYVTIAEKALEGVGMAASPGAFLVDFIPFLKYIPEWLPGASFKRKAREWYHATMSMREVPFAAVIENMKTGNAAPSFVSNLLTELEEEDNDEQIEVIKNCAAVVYAAAAESTVSTLSSFILAMLTNPEVQEKAQEEIDRVIGRERLPEFEDRTSLPYVNAILSEVLRWNPVAPLGLPHMVRDDSEFNGYHIPAQTIVVGNTWGILNDPETFPDPRRFNPERFMKTDDIEGTEHMPQLSPMNPLSGAFGYGRRICPGRFMADAQVWISIACILSVFHISPARNEDGQPIVVEPAFSDRGFICHPLPFKVSLKPRGDIAKVLIEQTELTA